MNGDERNGSTRERYRTIEYRGTVESVTVIQDTENDRAWVQSDVTVEIRP
jgi:hypothetical protein